MRIVAGRHRGRRLALPETASIRPTADRTREALFNILESGRFSDDGGAVEGTQVLDAFAGTGALGLEALSRGAERAFFMESDPAARSLCLQNFKTLGESERAEVVACDVLRPPPAAAACGLVLMDPPYRRALASPALTALAAAGWIAPGAIVVVEQERGEAFATPPGFAELDTRHYGRAKLLFLKLDQALEH